MPSHSEHIATLLADVEGISQALHEAKAKTEYKVELANKVVGGRVVGNLYGVAEYVGGKRRDWALKPQADEKKARDTAKKLNKGK